MITLFDLWENFIGEVNTHQGGHVKPNRNFKNWCNTISKDIFNDLYAEYEKTRVISTMLNPFLVVKNVVVTGIPNQMWDQVVKPSNYNYFASARRLTKNGKSCGCNVYDTIDSAGKETECDQYIDEDELQALQMQADNNLCEVVIDKVKTNQWAAVCQHKTKGPTIEKPKCAEYDGGLMIAPKNMGIIILSYFRKPKEATFEYTITNPGAENEYIQYNSSTSQPLEWDDKMMPEFLSRLKDKYGVFVREPLISMDGKSGSKV